MKKLILAVVTSVTLFSGDTSLIEFKSGGVIRASEMNQNFKILENVDSSLKSQLEKLIKRVVELELILKGYSETNKIESLPINGVISIGNLMFQDYYPEGYVRYLPLEDAKKYCEELELFNYSDWKLPSLEALKVVAYPNKSKFKNIVEDIYWSSTGGNYSDYKYVRFSDGYSYKNSSSNSYYVLCVRDN